MKKSNKFVEAILGKNNSEPRTIQGRYLIRLNSVNAIKNCLVKVSQNTDTFMEECTLEICTMSNSGDFAVLFKNSTSLGITHQTGMCSTDQPYTPLPWH